MLDPSFFLSFFLRISQKQGNKTENSWIFLKSLWIKRQVWCSRFDKSRAMRVYRTNRIDKKKNLNNFFVVDLSTMEKAAAVTSTLSVVIRPPSEKKKEENRNEQREEWVLSKKSKRREREKAYSLNSLDTSHSTINSLRYHPLKWTNTMASVEAVSISWITEELIWYLWLGKNIRIGCK